MTGKRQRRSAGLDETTLPLDRASAARQPCCGSAGKAPHLIDRASAILLRSIADEPMAQSSNRIFDEIARLATDAVGRRAGRPARGRDRGHDPRSSACSRTWTSPPAKRSTCCATWWSPPGRRTSGSRPGSRRSRSETAGAAGEAHAASGLTQRDCATALQGLAACCGQGMRTHCDAAQNLRLSIRLERGNPRVYSRDEAAEYAKC